MRTAIISANYGRYDSVKPIVPQDDYEVDWIYVTDDQEIAAEALSLGWSYVYLSPLPDLHPNRAAKHPKMEPWDYTDCDNSIWIDASFRIKSSTMAKDLLGLADPIAQFLHPWRDCIYDEAEASIGLAKYFGEPIDEQVDRYRLGILSQHPKHWGLWATGLIAMQHTIEVKRMGGSWLTQCLNWSFQDQISQPVVLRINGLRPNSIPGTHFSNDWVVYEGSGNH